MEIHYTDNHRRGKLSNIKVLETVGKWRTRIECDFDGTSTSRLFHATSTTEEQWRGRVMVVPNYALKEGGRYDNGSCG